MSRELLEELLEITKDPMRWHCTGSDLLARYELLVKQAEAELAKTLPEPVAIVGETYSLLWTGKGHLTPGLKVGDKLYAGPPAAPEQKTDYPERMSDDEIAAILEKLDFKLMVTADDLFYLIARSVEQEAYKRAHGIKE
jgi:hypothetical protein